MITTYLPDAAQELQNAALYYQHQQAGLGEAFLSEVEKAEYLLQTAPKAWTKLDKNIRRISLQRFPYHLIYTLKPENIIVLAVSHHRRHPDYWRSRV